MSAKVSAKRIEKCKLLTRLLGRNVENLDDYSCPKNPDLNGEGKAHSSWICSSYPFVTKKGFTPPRGKQRCMETGLRNI